MLKVRRVRCQERAKRKSLIRNYAHDLRLTKGCYLRACQYREELPRFPITQVVGRKPAKAKRRFTRLSTLSTLEVLVSRLGGVACFRGEGGPWHILQVVRSPYSSRKRRFFYCPSCSGKGRMAYLIGVGRWDLACDRCVPLPSIQVLLKSRDMLNMRYALRIKDYETAAAILQSGPRGALIYHIAVDTGQSEHFLGEYMPDLRKNDARHKKLLQKTRKTDYIRVGRLPGRLLYADKTLIVRRR